MYGGRIRQAGIERSSSMSRIGDSGNSGNQTANLNEAAQQVGQNLRDLGGQVREAAKEKYEQLTDQARSYYDEGRRAAQEWEQGFESFIQDKPMQAVLIAAGVGLLLGLLWKR
jgi:ElaB/YqjD/DUF883 family membrane-anchored ribosome-binding protein